MRRSTTMGIIVDPNPPTGGVATGEYILTHAPSWATQWCIAFEAAGSNALIAGPACANIGATLTLSIPVGSTGHWRVGAFEVEAGQVLRQEVIRVPSESGAPETREVVIDGNHQLTIRFTGSGSLSGLNKGLLIGGLILGVILLGGGKRK